MFLVISIIIFLLFLLVSGCKVDTAGYVWEKPFPTLTTLNLTGFPTTQGATRRNRISVIYGDYSANESRDFKRFSIKDTIV